MSFTRWLRNLQAVFHLRNASGNARRAGRNARPRFRPWLEVLEGRLAPAVLTVNTAADETAADNTLSLREAIGVVNSQSEAGLSAAERAQISGTLGSNDTILFDPGLNGQTITLTEGELDVTTSVAITGPGANKITVSGNNTNRVFDITAGTVSLSGLTIANGNSGGDFANRGGAIFDNATLTVSNCSLSSNSAVWDGGGIFANGPLTVSNCTLSGNSASLSGGGIEADGPLAVSNCNLSGNSSNEGGGILAIGTLTAVSDCTFSGNSATGAGGGIFVEGKVTVSSCTFSSNSASVGGAVLNSASLTLTSCTVWDNSAGIGGGIYNDGGTMTLTNCTISGNSASSYGGGGIFEPNPDFTTLANTIVAGNTASTGPDVLGTVISQGYNLIGNPDGGSGFVATDLLGLNPLLGPLQDNGGPTRTMALLPGSPAINAGSNALAVDPSGNPLATDQRGFPRIVGGTVDIGAFERQAPVLTVPGAQTAAQDVALAVPGIHVADVDSNTLSVTLTAGHGTLTLASTTGLTVTGKGSGALSLSGSIADLNAALAGLVYQGNLHYGGSDTLNVTASDGSLSTQASVTITVQSVAQEAANLQAQVNALYTAGVLNKGQANALTVKLRLQDNGGDGGRVQSFLNQVDAWLAAGILTAAQADPLLAAGQTLLAGLAAH
jgi:predicted outer membrane repeat protein